MELAGEQEGGESHDEFLKYVSLVLRFEYEPVVIAIAGNVVIGQCLHQLVHVELLVDVLEDAEGYEYHF